MSRGFSTAGWCVVALAVVACASGPRRAADASAPPLGNAFYMLLGSDTMTAERFTRSSDRIEGEHVDRVRHVRTSYVATLTPDGRITRIETTRAAAGVVPVRATLSIAGDSVVQESDGRRVRAVAVPAGTQLLLPPSAAILEQSFRRARRAKDSISFPAIAFDEHAWHRATIRWVGPDSATMSYTPADVPVRFSVSPAGQLLRYPMGTTPQLYMVRGR